MAVGASRSVIVHWRGPEIYTRVVEVATAAIDEALKEAEDFAQAHHAWMARGGKDPVEEGFWHGAAHFDAGVIWGEWGNESEHAVFLEIGTSHMQARPYLRPAQDHVTHGLADHLQGV